MIDNRGNGSANAMRISSLQPEIVENEKGLLVDFKLIGTRVDMGPIGAALQAVPLGSLEPHTTRVVQWYLTSSLMGVFTSFDVEMEHTSPLGNPQLSLVDSVAAHTLVHVVRLPGDADDGKPDFVVKGEPALSDVAVYDSRDPSQPLLLHQASGSLTVIDGQYSAVATVLVGGSRLVRIANTLPAGAAVAVLQVGGSTIPAENVWFERRTVRYDSGTEEVNDMYIFDYQPDTSMGNSNVTYSINVTSAASSGDVSGTGSTSTPAASTGTAVSFTTPPAFEFTPETTSTTPLVSSSSSTSSLGNNGATTTKPQSKADGEQSGIPIWIVVVVIVLVLVLLALGLLWRRHRHRLAEVTKEANAANARMMANPLYDYDSQQASSGEYSSVLTTSAATNSYGMPLRSGTARVQPNGAYAGGEDEVDGLYADAGGSGSYGLPVRNGDSRVQPNGAYAGGSGNDVVDDLYADAGALQPATYGREQGAHTDGRSLVNERYAEGTFGTADYVDLHPLPKDAQNERYAETTFGTAYVDLHPLPKDDQNEPLSSENLPGAATPPTDSEYIDVEENDAEAM